MASHKELTDFWKHRNWHLRFKQSSSDTVGRNRGRRTEHTSVNKPTSPRTARGRSRNNSTHIKAVASGRKDLPELVPDAIAPKTGNTLPKLLAKSSVHSLSSGYAFPSPYGPNRTYPDEVKQIVHDNGAGSSRKSLLFSPCDRRPFF